MTQWQPTFDGLTLAEAAPGGLQAAAVATLESLDSLGLLQPRHALTCQLIVQLSGALDRDMLRGRITVAASNAQRLLLDAIDALPTPAASVDSSWEEFQAALSEINERQTQ